MAKEKWNGVLSTTQRNNIELIQVRMHNVNSETLTFDITDRDGELYDLTSKQVLFCTYFDRYAPVEQRAEISKVQKGRITYIMNQHDMQKPVKVNFAYFKIMDSKGQLVDTTQNFSYYILDSIENRRMNAQAYIIRLEEILDSFGAVKDQYIKEIEEIISEFNKQVIEQQKEFEGYIKEQQEQFDNWFESVRDILESIDPGGLLLNEIVVARDGEKSLDARLRRDKRQLQAQIDFVKNEHYLTRIGEINKTRTLIDNDFSMNHTVSKMGEVDVSVQTNPIIIATVDDSKQNRFKLRKVGVI